MISLNPSHSRGQASTWEVSSPTWGSADDSASPRASIWRLIVSASNLLWQFSVLLFYIHRENDPVTSIVRWPYLELRAPNISISLRWSDVREQEEH